MRTYSPLFRGGTSALILAFACAIAPGAAAQDAPKKDAQSKPDEKPKEKPGELKPGATQSEVDKAVAERLRQIESKKPSEWSPDTLAERVALAYRGVYLYQLGRVFTAGREEGRITIATSGGELAGDYTRRFVNGPTMAQDRVRLDIIFETSPKPESQLRYTLGYNGATVWSAQNNEYTRPDPAAAAAYRASIVNDYTALFRYQEEHATLARLGTKKMQGLDLDVLELTHPDGTKMRLYISEKTFRILHIEYEAVLNEGQAPVTFRESYSEWTTIQQTLIPSRRKLRQNDQLVQTVDLKTATYGGTFEDSVFLQL